MLILQKGELQKKI